MKAFFATFRLGFLYLWRQPVSVIVLTAFPILLIFVLGNALGSLMDGQYDIDPVPAAYVSEDAGSPLYAFLTGEMSRLADVRRADRAEAGRLLEEGEVAAVIIEGGGVEFLAGSHSPQSAGLLLSLVEGFQQIGAAAALASDPRDIPALLQTDISVKTDAVGTHIPSAIDYYAVTMLVMISLYCGLNGSELFRKNLLGEFAVRVQAAPVKRRTVILGTMAASTAVSFLQLLITFTFSYAVYGVYWGDRIPLVLLTFLLMVVFSQLFCLCVLLVSGSQGAVAGIIQAIFWIFTFLSKGFFQVDFGEAEKVFQYIPNALAHTVIFGAAYGGNEQHMMTALAILAAVTAAPCGAAFMLGRRKLV